MPYTPQTWENDVSKLNATRMDYIESGIDQAHITADAAIPAPSSPASNDGLFWNGSSWVADKVDNAKIDSTAAIDVNKLAAGSDGQLLKTVGTTPTWSTVSDVDPIPTGTIMPYASTSAPGGYLLCDGSAVSRSTYDALFALIGEHFGAGNGTTTFNVPNLKGKVPVGIDTGQTEFDTRGETGGAKTHALVTGELASHSHSTGTYTTNAGTAHSHGIGTYAAANESSHTHPDGTLETTIDLEYKDNFTTGGTTIGVVDIENATGASGGSLVSAASDVTNSTGAGTAHTHTLSGTSGSESSHTHSISGTSGAAGSGTAHNNLQPYIALHYIIKT